MLRVITGCGYTGGRVLRRCPNAIGLSRSPMPTGANAIVFDIDSAARLPAGLGLGKLYQILYTVPPQGVSSDERLQRFLTLLPHPPERIVYLSTTGVYGNRDGALVDESAERTPSSARAQRRVAAETQLESYSAAQSTRLVVLRVPGIYGPGRLGVERSQSAGAIITEDEASPGNRIHVDDLASCCIAAFDAPAGVYNLGDGDWRSSSWFAKEVARQLGQPLPPEISRATAKESFSDSRWSFLSESRRVDTTKMRRILGVTPRYANAEDGIRASLADDARRPAE